MNEDGRRRLAPEAREAQLLEAAQAVLAGEGVSGLTLEAVAARAGVTAPLVRHYFGSRDGVLVAACRAELAAMMAVFTDEDATDGFPDRLARHLRRTREHPWTHQVWMHASEVHPEIAEMVVAARVRLVQLATGEAWEATPERRRYELLGWLGFLDAAVALWLQQGAGEVDTLLRTLVDSATALGLDLPT